MTLTQTAIITKQVITISLIALSLGTISFIGYKIWYANYLANLPKVEEKPDTKFGLLPPPNFPKTSVSSSNFSYSLDTTSGFLPKVGVDPNFEKLIKVYFIIKPYASLLSPEKTQALAEKFGIINSPQILSETNYLYSDQDKSLTVDLDSGNFAYTRQATPSAKENLDNDDKLIADFKKTLEQIGVLREELKNGRAKVILSKTEAGVAQISLWPESLDKKIIVTSDFNKSQVNATVLKSADTLENYLSLNFTYYQIDTTTFATYPTKPAEVAFEDLKSGKGVVVLEPLNPQVSITSIYLAYLLPDEYSPYLLPIFVFEGPNFVAYTSAITEQFLSPAK